MTIKSKITEFVTSPSIVFGTLFCVLMFLTFQKPLWLSSNAFLEDFIGSQLLSLLALVLTVTLASIANIHLTLTRIVADYPDSDKKEAVKGVADIAREEVNSSARGLFYSFFIAVGLLILDGHFIKETHQQGHVQSFVYSVCIMILVFNIWVLYDVYQSVISLSSNNKKTVV